MARFELGLMQLGKVPLSDHDILAMMSAGRSLQPVPFKVFLYTIEQIQDDTESGNASFREDMKVFLNLSEPIHIPHSNKIPRVAHPETIDICDGQFDNLRMLLLTQGKASARWILDKFIESPDVSVSGRGQFSEMLSSWGDDPCP